MKNTKDLFSQQLKPVYDTTADGKRILPNHNIKENPLRGIYVESRIVPATEERKEFTVHTFLTEDGQLVNVYGDYKLNKIVKSRLGYLFSIQYNGVEELDGGKKVNKYLVSESRGAVLSLTELSDYITEITLTTVDKEADKDDLPF